MQAVRQQLSPTHPFLLLPLPLHACHTRRVSAPLRQAPTPLPRAPKAAQGGKSREAAATMGIVGTEPYGRDACRSACTTLCSTTATHGSRSCEVFANPRTVQYGGNSSVLQGPIPQEGHKTTRPEAHEEAKASYVTRLQAVGLLSSADLCIPRLHCAHVNAVAS